MNFEKHIQIIFFIFLLLLGIYFLYLAFNTEMLGEDEEAYFRLGKEVSQGKLPLFNPGPIKRPQAFPMFVPAVYSLPFILFGSSLGLAKAIIVIFGLLTLLVVYLIGLKINNWFGIFSASILLSLPYFSHFSLISYVEIPIAFFSVLIVYTFLNMDNYKKAILSGIILSLSFYTKASGLFLIFSMFLFIIIFYFIKKDKKYLKFGIVSIIIAALFSSVFIIRSLIAFNYPYGLYAADMFFEFPAEYKSASWVSEISTAISQKFSFTSYISLFGLVSFILIIFGFSYFFVNFKDLQLFDKKILLISVLIFFLFLFAFNVISTTAVGDPRYFSIIFPQIALIGGYFLYKIKEENKYLLVIILIIVVFSIYSGITSAVTTSNSTRYPEDYVEVLTWINKNTPKDSVIFTTYGGSVRYFAERNIVWNAIEEFPDIMRTGDSTYIYDNLKKYDVSYILVWRSLVSQDIIIPGSNILGVFTYNFVDKVMNDKEHFEIVHQNQNNVVIKLN